MSRENVLRQIREAEKKKAETEIETRSRKEKILQDKARESREILENASLKADADASTYVKAEEARILARRQTAVRAGELEVAALRKKSEGQLPGAVDNIVALFKKEANA